MAWSRLLRLGVELRKSSCPSRVPTVSHAASPLVTLRQVSIFLHRVQHKAFHKCAARQQKASLAVPEMTCPSSGVDEEEGHTMCKESLCKSCREELGCERHTLKRQTLAAHTVEILAAPPILTGAVRGWDGRSGHVAKIGFSPLCLRLRKCVEGVLSKRSSTQCAPWHFVGKTSRTAGLQNSSRACNTANTACN